MYKAMRVHYRRLVFVVVMLIPAVVVVIFVYAPGSS